MLNRKQIAYLIHCIGMGHVPFMSHNGSTYSATVTDVRLALDWVNAELLRLTLSRKQPSNQSKLMRNFHAQQIDKLLHIRVELDEMTDV